MGRRVLLVMLTALIAAIGAAAAGATSYPTLSASFPAGTAAIGDQLPLTVTITGPDGAAAYGNLEVVGYLSQGLSVNPATISGCGTTVTVTAPSPIPGAKGPPAILATGATAPAGQSCSFSVPVTVVGAGALSAQLTLSSNADYTGPFVVPATATVTAPATAAPALVSSSFAPTSVTAGAATLWSVTIRNPNPDTTLTGVRFSALTDGEPFTATTLTADTCRGVDELSGDPAAAGPAPLEDLEFAGYGGGTLAPGASCTVSVSLQPVPFAGFTSATVTAASNEGGASAPSSAIFDQLEPRTAAPSNRFSHRRPRIGSGGAVTDTVHVPGRGVIRLITRWRGRQIAYHVVLAPAAGTFTIRAVPGARVRGRLRAHRGAIVRAALSFTPNGGRARTVKLTVRTAG